MNQFEREQAQIKAMWRRVYELRAMSEEMHFRREATKREIETYPDRHENRMRVVRIVHWANVNNAVRYAAELTRRVECMDRVEEKQKGQLEMLKKAGDAVIAENTQLERAIARMKDELRLAKLEEKYDNMKITNSDN
ncbi:unnamed protein product [Caenorhabditis nigoni]